MRNDSYELLGSFKMNLVTVIIIDQRCSACVFAIDGNMLFFFNKPVEMRFS